jgi:hypothetical protein
MLGSVSMPRLEPVAEALQGEDVNVVEDVDHRCMVDPVTWRWSPPARL